MTTSILISHMKKFVDPPSDAGGKSWFVPWGGV